MTKGLQGGSYLQYGDRLLCAIRFQLVGIKQQFEHSHVKFGRESL